METAVISPAPVPWTWEYLRPLKRHQNPVLPSKLCQVGASASRLLGHLQHQLKETSPALPCRPYHLLRSLMCAARLFFRSQIHPVHVLGTVTCLSI